LLEPMLKAVLTSYPLASAFRFKHELLNADTI